MECLDRINQSLERDLLKARRLFSFHFFIVGADIPAKFLTVTFFQELKRRLRLVGEGGLVGMNVIPTQLLETEALLDKAIAVFGEEQCTAEYIAGPSGTYEDGNALLLCSATSSK